MAVFGRLFRGLPWEKLVPDERHAVVTAGLGTFGEKEYATAAWVPDGTLAIAYLPTARPVTVDMGRFRGRVEASWLDPTDGGAHPADGSPFQNAGTRELAPPGPNRIGDDDWVLLLNTVR
jgi:hypothetical protein